MMSGEGRRIRKHLTVQGVVCLLMAVLLCGCGAQEITKTVVLSNGTKEEHTGINIKNIQEYTYEEGVIDVTWSDDAIGSLCVVWFPGEQGMCRKIDVYQKTVSEEIVFEENVMGYVKAAPGGKYIVYLNMVDDIQELVVYEVETGKREVYKDWNLTSNVDEVMWSGDGTKMFVRMNIVDGEDGTEYVYRFDMESEEKTESQVKIPAVSGDWVEMFPNEDGSKVFVEEYFGEEEMEKERKYIESDEWNIGIEGNMAAWAGNPEMSGTNKRGWILDMETGGVEELDSAWLNIGTPVKYTEEGLFGTDGDKLWIARGPLGQTPGKRLLEEECMDICICEKGDHVFLIEREAGTNHLQVTGILLEDGEIQEYQVLYKGIDGDYEQAFTGMDDHELVIQSVGHKEDEWFTKTTVLEY